MARWRLWIVRGRGLQLKNHAAGKPNWKYAWSVDWGLLCIYKESGGNPLSGNGKFLGLMGIWWKHNPRVNLYNGGTNIMVGAQQYARLNTLPWACWAR